MYMFNYLDKKVKNMLNCNNNINNIKNYNYD